MAENKTLLELISGASGDAWINGVTGKDSLGPPDPYYRPTRKKLAKHTDEDLAELIVGKPETREAEIARSILRRRESWRTPATPALAISLLSFALAAWAFARTF
jgi:hypothetical protein